MKTQTTGGNVNIQFARSLTEDQKREGGWLPINSDEAAKQLTHLCMDAIDRREARNPFTEAFNIVHFTLPKAFAKSGDAKEFSEAAKYIDEELFIPMRRDKSFTEDAFNEFLQDAFSKGAMVDVTEQVVAYCVLAVTAYLEGKTDIAWSLISDAAYWAGVVTVSAKRRHAPGPAKLLAQMKKAKLQKEYLKIENYWSANIDRKLSAQKAADKIMTAEITTFSHKKIAEIVSALRRGETFR